MAPEHSTDGFSQTELDWFAKGLDVHNKEGLDEHDNLSVGAVLALASGSEMLAGIAANHTPNLQILLTKLKIALASGPELIRELTLRLAVSNPELFTSTGGAYKGAVHSSPGGDPMPPVHGDINYWAYSVPQQIANTVAKNFIDMILPDSFKSIKIAEIALITISLSLITTVINQIDTAQHGGDPQYWIPNMINCAIQLITYYIRIVTDKSYGRGLEALTDTALSQGAVPLLESLAS